MEIKWSEFAKNNLKDFISNSKMISPFEYISSLVRYTNCLTEQNYLGKVISYEKSKEIRQLIYEKHRILYTINKGNIYIIAVIHMVQSLDVSLKFLKKYFKEKD